MLKGHAKRRRLVLPLICLALARIGPFCALLRVSAELEPGCGTKDKGPCEIFSNNDLYQIHEKPDKHYVLMNDLQIEKHIPIAGINHPVTGYYDGTSDPFTGIFDGNGHTIRYTIPIVPGLDPYAYQGLFGIAGPNAEIFNLTIKDAFLYCDSLSGALVGGVRDGGVTIHDVTVENVSMRCSQDPRHGPGEGTGGLVGYLGGARESFISCCHVRGGMVLGEDSVGGLIGHFSNGFIDKCSTEELKFGANDYGEYGARKVGGLVGSMQKAAITNSFSTIDVQPPVYEDAGGLVGIAFEGSSISNSYAVGDVNAIRHHAGGLVGSMDKLSRFVKNSFATGSVSVDARNGTGGLIGHLASSIKLENNYFRMKPGVGNYGAVKTEAQHVESLIYFQDGNNNAPISAWNDSIWDFGSNTYPTLKRCATIEVPPMTGLFPADFNKVTCAYSSCLKRVLKRYEQRTKFNKGQSSYDASLRKALSARAIIKSRGEVVRSLNKLTQAMEGLENLGMTAPGFSKDIGRRTSFCAISLVQKYLVSFRGVISDNSLSKEKKNLAAAKSAQAAKEWKKSVTICRRSVWKMMNELGESSIPLC